jgi:hypothetical protein
MSQNMGTRMQQKFTGIFGGQFALHFQDFSAVKIAVAWCFTSLINPIRLYGVTLIA